MRMRIPYISLLAAGALALGGCAYGDFGYGGLGYGGYYGASYGYSPYYGYGGYGGYGYGYDPFGWYGDYYYPGTGIYVYDTGRNRHVWTDSQRRYWSSRRDQWQHRSGHTWTKSDWSAYNDRHHHRDH